MTKCECTNIAGAQGEVAPVLPASMVPCHSAGETALRSAGLVEEIRV
jgi:hypothetical protein